MNDHPQTYKIAREISSIAESNVKHIIALIILRN